MNLIYNTEVNNDETEEDNILNELLNNGSSDEEYNYEDYVFTFE